MMNKKSAKKALISSALCLLLCMSMLIGTTFAWFTDKVESGKNRIVAGNLDVELEYAKVVDGVKQPWAPVAGEDEIFDPNALWEPGHVEVVYLKVSNLGSLELKYQLGVNVVGETSSISVETNKEFKLSDYLVFKTVEMPNALTTYTDREAAQLAAGTEMGLNDYNGNTTKLEVGGTDYVALIVYMPETVGNVANYKQGAPVPTIELGVNLYATQVEAENDSFGPDYDEDAWHPQMQVYSLEDLQNRINAGETNIVLMNDIVITDETALDTTSSALPAAIVINHGKPMTLDLNGHSIVMEEKGTEQTTLLFVHNTDVTIKGEGVLEQKGLDNSYTIWAKGASTVKIESGKFVSNTADKKGIMLYASGNTAWDSTDDYATIDVYGGEFISASTGDPQYYANVMNHGVGKINYYGGTFNWDPAKDVQADDRAHIKVADGYKAVDNGDGTYIILKGEEVVTNDAELAAAIAAGKTEIAMAPGNYQFPASAALRGKNLTLIGTKGVVIDTSKVDARNQFVTGATLEFDGVTLNFGKANYMGFANTASLTYKNCQINGLQFLYGKYVAFENCDLNSNGAEHCVWTYGVQNVSFTDCDFTYGDRGINCYSDNDVAGGKQNVSFTNCTFATENENSVGAVEVNSSAFSVGIDVTMNGCTAPEHGQMAYISEYDTTAGAKTSITVDGKDTYVVAVGNKWANAESDAAVLKAALSSEKKETTIVLLEDVAINIGTGWKMGGANTESITINGNGKTVTLSSTYRSYFNMANENGVLNLKNMTLTNLHKGTHFFDYTTHFNCDVVAEDVIFAKSPLVDDGVKGVFTNCEFSQAGTDIYGLWIMSGSDVTVNGGELKTDRGFKISDEDSAEEKTVLKVTDTKFNNTKKAAILVTTNYGAEISLSNLDITNCGADSTNAVWIDDGRTATADKIVVTGGSVITEP